MEKHTIFYYGCALLGLPVSNFFAIYFGYNLEIGQLIGNLTYLILLLSIFLIHFGITDGLKNSKENISPPKAKAMGIRNGRTI